MHHKDYFRVSIRTSTKEVCKQFKIQVYKKPKPKICRPIISKKKTEWHTPNIFTKPEQSKAS